MEGKGGAVAKLLTERISARGADRDEELRSAHRVAFERIRTSADSPEHHKAITQAVENLIDACETYLDRH
jgi:hypothetical protein